MTQQITAIWPKCEKLILGNLITFRQEIEMLAFQKKAEKAHIYFGFSQEEVFAKAPYITQGLMSSIDIQLHFLPELPMQIDWPPKELKECNWDYGSIKRVSLLKQITGIFPSLSWPELIQRKARDFLASQKKISENVLALHLKQQSKSLEESNANLPHWKTLFEENKSVQFVLLGKDALAENILKLPNVVSAEALGLELSTQLAFCNVADGFLGMASGICSGAIFSEKPYVIFKHPKHHPEEMLRELGDSNRFGFSKEDQQLWRMEDNLANLKLALLNLLNRKNEESFAHAK